LSAEICSRRFALRSRRPFTVAASKEVVDNRAASTDTYLNSKTIE